MFIHLAGFVLSECDRQNKWEDKWYADRKMPHCPYTDGKAKFTQGKSYMDE